MLEAIHEQLIRLDLFIGETEAVYHEATLKLGLTDSAMNVLYTICMFDGVCPLKNIAALSGLPKQTINSALRKLEREEVLYLESVDGRKKRACLTEKGRELCDGTVMLLMHMEDEIIGSWLPEERELYLSLTRRYLDALREQIKEL